MASNATLALNAALWFLLGLFAIAAAPFSSLSLEQLYHLCPCPVFPGQLWMLAFQVSLDCGVSFAPKGTCPFSLRHLHRRKTYGRTEVMIYRGIVERQSSREECVQVDTVL